MSRHVRVWICSWGNRSRDALKLCIELGVPAASRGSWIPIIQRRASVILYKFMMMSHRLEHVVDSEMEACFLAFDSSTSDFNPH
jgi:hypothetical protein